MSPTSRHEKPLPGWHDLSATCARALERKLRSAGKDSGLPESLQPSPQPPARRSRLTLGRALGLAGLAVLYVHLAWIMATSVLIIAYRWVDPSVTVLMAYRAWDDGWKLERPRDLALKQVPAYLRSMLVAIEDDKFYEHHGLDFQAFERAREINARLKQPLYGGSTLTMQVSRTLFLVPVKSYVRKYFEVIAALELELFLPKARILELYFGYAEWGKGVFGIEAAARHHYGRSVTRLSREEGARLIALLSSPIKYKPSNLERSLILRERYNYLVRRYVSREEGAAVTPPLPPPPATPEPGSEEAAPAAGAAPSTGSLPSVGTAAMAPPSGASAD
jgi:monofunctional biosynthetic peptidoglycan transglycosylase